MNVLVPYFLTGMAVTAFGCTDDVTNHPAWNALRANYKSNPIIVWIAITIAMSLCVCFWPFVLWTITKGRRR
jgi:hypothetical protein